MAAGNSVFRVQAAVYFWQMVFIQALAFWQCERGSQWYSRSEHRLRVLGSRSQVAAMEAHSRAQTAALTKAEGEKDALRAQLAKETAEAQKIAEKVPAGADVQRTGSPRSS